MPKFSRVLSSRFLLAILFLTVTLSLPSATERKELTFVDIMKFKQIVDPVLSADGDWVAFVAQPDRGDGEAVIRSRKKEVSFKIERGSRPVLAKNSGWACLAVKPKAVDEEKAGADKPKTGMALVRLTDGETVRMERVDRFSFSEDSAWLAYLSFKDEPKTAEKGAVPDKKPKKETGARLVLRRLATGQEILIPQVLSFVFDKTGRFLAYDRLGPEAKDNGLYVRDLQKEGAPEKALVLETGVRFSQLTWSEQDVRLAFLAGPLNDQDKVGPNSLHIWDGRAGLLRKAVASNGPPAGWAIPDKNKLVWAKDGQRLFFGLKPLEFFDRDESKKEESPANESDLFDPEKILAKREVDIWHWNDPLIIPQQKKAWPQTKDKIYTAVYHLESGRMVPLADRELPEVEPVENPTLALGLSNVPYQKEITWNDASSDIFAVSLKDGLRKKIASRIASRPALSPGGRFVAFYNQRDWHLYDSRTGRTTNLTEKTGVPFYDENHDRPDPPPGYGLAGWLEGDAAVLINDKYDVWIFPTDGSAPSALTGGEGRRTGRIFRVLRTDAEKRFFKKGQSLLLSMVHDREKHHGFYAAVMGRPGVSRLLEDKKKFVFIAKAEKTDTVLYTRESFEEFPDLWTAGPDFAQVQKLSEANPQIRDFAWGSAELVDWLSLDGRPLQGVLIKPAGYEAGKTYPVLVYFYELSSQRLYEYNQTVVNHRPCFPVYASHGTCVFLPDVRFEVGRPGLSFYKCIVPGVQKLVDRGVADPRAIGLHGHSWGGYGTAFLVTQTDIFACAIAGAAVSNMTSAYSGIRWESGMARQFQYEKDQSRIGGNLWEKREDFLANSAVFAADRIRTPLLLMHGDEDGAVPWYQSIELYLALRRLGKECIFLQYRGEPHHPQKYPNKLDYAIKMMEFLDHYLTGKPAPEWMTKGLPYRGR
ncbi:MAG TPA: prolyl oligopeptidase family serine peptidase [Acidobacteriota bacterium]